MWIFNWLSSRFHSTSSEITGQHPSTNFTINCGLLSLGTFLSRNPTQTNISLRHSIESLFDSFCLIPFGKYFRFHRTVPVRLVPSANNVSSSGTVVSKLSVYKWYPIHSKGPISWIHTSWDIPHSPAVLLFPS